MKKKAIFDCDEGKSMFIYGEIAEAYEKEIADFDSSECKHEKVTRCLWKLNSGVTQLKDFCDTCGKDISKSLKQADFPGEYPQFDETIRRQYAECRDSAKKKLLRKYVALQKVQDQKLAEDAKGWDDEYQAYRRTEKWQKKRFRVFERARGVCEGCRERQAVLVHHTTYSHIGDELLFQLVALCRDCHELCHPEKAERSFYDNDYLPCFDCRWFCSPADCGRAEQKCYEALSPDGKCGPKFGLFEGLK